MPATDNAVEGTSRNSVVFTVFKKQPKLAVLFLSFFQGGNLSGIEDSFRFGEGSIVDECDREPTL